MLHIKIFSKLGSNMDMQLNVWLSYMTYFLNFCCQVNGHFNKISVDQAVEYVNKISNDIGGIVGLTENN